MLFPYASPPSGWLYDVTGRYVLSFWMAGASVMISCISLIPIVVADLRKKHSETPRTKYIIEAGETIPVSVEDRAV